MNVIDMHCDTLMIAYLQKTKDIYEMPGMVDLKRMKQGGAKGQFFAIFLLQQRMREKYPDYTHEEYISACVKILKDSITAHKDMIAFAGSSEDIEKNSWEGKMSAILTIEDGSSVNGNMENLKRYYDMGVRAINLTWNYENCFGAPNSREPSIMSKGLTDFGKEAVLYMQELGIMVDVSHLSDGGFWDVAKLCKKPFIASHSNCRALCPHPRNLTDEMIKSLAKHGGVMGINFAPQFLNADMDEKRSRVERMVAMAQHMKQVGGIDVIGVGSDLDGIEGDLEIGSPDKMALLADGLKKGGFTESEVDKIFSGNVLRVMKDVIG